jgi:hypothetical protein
MTPQPRRCDVTEGLSNDTGVCTVSPYYQRDTLAVALLSASFIGNSFTADGDRYVYCVP